jgi:Kdo2-lipid IVA lauroyltransferase/acyltransferase
MSDRRGRRLLHRIEGLAYWAFVAPLLARLPASLGYRAACRRADWLHRNQPAKRTEIARNLRRVLGNQLSRAEAEQATRDWFRLASCNAVDVRRMRHGARPLRRLVEIRGLDHLESALAAGRGAIVCSGHFGSFDCAFSLLGAIGLPVTTIGRWQYKYTAGLSRAERRFWELVYARPLRRHRKRPNIEPWRGRFQVAALAAAALKAGEVVTIAIDAPPLDSDMDRAIGVPFLGRQARLLPGVVTLSQLTGAPVLMCFMYRCADYRHQVLEISAPMAVTEDLPAAFGRCAAEVSAAILAHPAHWVCWASSGDLVTLGLVPSERESARHARSSAAFSVMLNDGRPDDVVVSD